MDVLVRPAVPSDAPALGRISYAAFSAIATEHGFPPDVTSEAMGAGIASSLIGHRGVFGVVAEVNGRIAGSNFLYEGNSIASIGPLTVDPAVQNGSVGRALMRAVIERAEQRAFPGVRLVQAAYHCRSLALYLKLGFEVRELLTCLQGPPMSDVLAGYDVRPATVADITACDTLCFRVHGHTRSGELADAVAQGRASVVERDGRIAGYATPVAFFGHAVAETNDDLQALIAAASPIPGPGVLVPARNGELIRWCLAKGLRVTQTMTLMSMGLYGEPNGAWLPSIHC